MASSGVCFEIQKDVEVCVIRSICIVEYVVGLCGLVYKRVLVGVGVLFFCLWVWGGSDRSRYEIGIVWRNQSVHV